MDESDFTIFGRKSNKSKRDKVDVSCVNSPLPSDIIKKDIISRPTDEEEYNCDNPKAGIALIFNHKNIKGQVPRVGTEKDRDGMRDTLLNYGFDVRVYDDLTFDKVNEKLKSAAGEDHSQHDCLVVVVMSHGLEGKVFAQDISYPVERLWNPFLGEHCTTLINKPKLFFLQACRGELLEKAVTYELAIKNRMKSTRMLLSVEEPPVPRTITYAIPNTADIIIMYATFNKYYSFRNVQNGSWFIQSLCRVFNEAAASSPEGSELLRLLTAVNRTVAYEYQSHAKHEALDQMKEMPNFLSTLTKTFYLRVKRPIRTSSLPANDLLLLA